MDNWLIAYSNWYTLPMNQSLSITFVLEGGLPNLYLSVQDNYSCPAQIFNVPLEFVDFGLLVGSVQTSGDYWIVTASPDNPRFQIESAIQVRHVDGLIHWDLVYEHYEPFLNIDLEEDADEYDENVISFSFDPFQYVSALYQACQLSHQLRPTTFTLPDDKKELEHPIFGLAQYIPRLNILWQKYGQTDDRVKDGQPTQTSDYFAHEAETQWLQELLDTLDQNHNDSVMENIDAYLESLPDDVLSQLEGNSKPLEDALIQRWEKLVNSLTEEEADALENDQITSKFPNSLKLRLMREFLEGNPSVLLGNTREVPSNGEKVIDMQNWKLSRTAPHEQP